MKERTTPRPHGRAGAAAVLFLFLFAGPLLPAAGPGAEGDSLVSFLENYYAGVKRAVLSDGLAVIVKEKHAAPLVGIQAWIRAGSVFEGADLGSGLSHVLEHMLFDGTGEVRDGEGRVLFPAYGRGDVRRLAHEMGGFANAYTSFDRAVFHVTVRSERAREAIRMIGHMVMHASLEGAVLEEEKKAIANEFSRDLDRPGFVLKTRVYGNLYRTHPARVPVFGYPANVKRLDVKTLRAYYKKRYVPNNMALVVAGDVDAEEVIAWARETFIGPDSAHPFFPRGAVPETALPPEPPRNAPLVDLFENPGTSFVSGEIAFPTVGIHHPDLFALDILADILGRGPSSILQEKLIDEAPGGSVLAVRSGHNTPLYEGRFYISFRLRPETDVFAFRDRVLAEIEKLKKEPLPPGEIRRAADRIGMRMVKSLSKVRRICTNLGKTWLNLLPPRFDLQYLESLRATSPGEVAAAARRYLDHRRLVLTVMGPKGFVRRGEGEKKPALAAAPPEPALKRLSNGLPLVLEENGEFPTAVLTAAVEGGVLRENAGNNGSFRMMAALLPRGTAKYDRAALDRIRGDRGIEIRTAAGRDLLTVSVTVMARDFPLGCEILGELLLRPSFPELELEGLEKEALLAAEERDKTPASRAFAELWKAVFAGRPYAMDPGGTAASLARITPKSLERLRESSLVPESTAIAVVGAFDPGEAARLLEPLFGSLAGAPSEENAAGEGGGGNEAGPSPVNRAGPPPPAALEGRRDRVILLPGVHQASVFIGFPGPAFGDPGIPPLDVLAEILTQRLLDDLRIARGLVYDARASFFSGLGGGLFWIEADTREKERTGEILAACFEEVGALGKTLLSEKELEGARNTLLARRAFAREDPAATALGLAASVLYGEPPGRAAREEEALARVKAGDVRRAARRFLDPGACRTVTVKP